jgi:hypothetical protein
VRLVPIGHVAGGRAEFRDDDPAWATELMARYREA